MRTYLTLARPRALKRLALVLVWSAPFLLSCAGKTPVPDNPPTDGCNEIGIARHDLDAEIDPDESYLRAESHIRLCTSTTSVTFFLNRKLEISSVTANGESLSPKRSSDEEFPYVKDAVPWTVRLGEDPPTEVALDITYEGRLPGVYSGVNRISTDLVELALYAGWYPMLKGSDAFQSRLEVALPADYDVAARGDRVAEETADGQRRETWEATTPGDDIVVIAAPNLSIATREVAGKKVRVYSSRLGDGKVERILDVAGRSLKFYRNKYGAAPGADSVQIVYSPRGGWGYSRSGLIAMSEKLAQTRIGKRETFRELAHGIAHEMAHFWWDLADSSTTDDWINEALAEYSALRVSDDLFGKRETTRWMKRYFQHLDEKSPDRPITETTSESEFRYVNWYERGALFFEALARDVGRGSLHSFLRGLRDRCDGEPLTTDRLESWMVEDFGGAIEEILSAWLHQTELPGRDAVGLNPADNSGEG